MSKAVKKHNKVEDVSHQLLGKKIMCIALLGAIYQCQHCLRVKKKGMFVEYEKKLFCSEYCIKQSQRVSK